MRTWKSTIRDGERYLPLRHCVAVGCEVLAFNSAIDATRAYNALAKAVGRRDLLRFTFKPVSVVGEMPTFEGREYGLSTDLKLSLDARNIGTEDEVESVIEWHKRVTCDGTGVCSCWNHEEGTTCPMVGGTS